MMSLRHEDGNADDGGMMLLIDVQRYGADEVSMDRATSPSCRQKCSGRDIGKDNICHCLECFFQG